MADETEAAIYYREDIGAWWPRYDHKPEKCFQFVADGLGAIPVAKRYLSKRRQCVQAGGHAGYWAKTLAKLFDQVYTFEPELILFECLRRNCEGFANIHAYPIGLGAESKKVRFQSHVSAGSWKVDPEGDREIVIHPIDSLALKECDAIFLDVEGYEVQALQGAVETIRSTRPLILCELLPRSKAAIVDYLASIHYRQVARYGRDGIFMP